MCYVCAQVLSSSVANAFAYYDDQQTKETEFFVRQFDHLFDCMNVCNCTEWYTKDDLKPYTSPDDSRLEVRNLYLYDYESLNTDFHTCTIFFFSNSS